MVTYNVCNFDKDEKDNLNLLLNTLGENNRSLFNWILSAYYELGNKYIEMYGEKEGLDKFCKLDAKKASEMVFTKKKREKEKAKRLNKKNKGNKSWVKYTEKYAYVYSDTFKTLCREIFVNVVVGIKKRKKKYKWKDITDDFCLPQLKEYGNKERNSYPIQGRATKDVDGEMKSAGCIIKRDGNYYLRTGRSTYQKRIKVAEEYKLSVKGKKSRNRLDEIIKTQADGNISLLRVIRTTKGFKLQVTVKNRVFVKKVTKFDNPENEVVGVDINTKDLKVFVTSDGKEYNFDDKVVDKIKKIEDRIKANQRKRKRKEVKRLHEKRVNIMKDEIIRLSNKLSMENAKTIKKENITASTMRSKKRSNINKVLQWSPMGLFSKLMEDAFVRNGVNFDLVDPAYTSQTCHKCKKIMKKLGSKKEHICEHCGNEINRDINAANNIRDKKSIREIQEKNKKKRKKEEKEVAKRAK